MLEFLIALFLTVLVTFSILYAFFKGCNITFNINIKQQFSEEDRQLLEDLYNSEGDPKSEYDLKNSIDSVLTEVNNIMLDTEEESDG